MQNGGNFPTKQKQIMSSGNCLHLAQVGRASLYRGEDPGSIYGPARFSLSWYLIIQPSTEFSEVDMAEVM